MEKADTTKYLETTKTIKGQNGCPWLPLTGDMVVRMRDKILARPWVGV